MQPIRRLFGWGHGQCIDRHYIEDFLEEHKNDIKGRVLEIGDNNYTLAYGGDNVLKSDILHVDDSHPAVTIIADLTDAPHISSETFDCVILTQTLQFIFDIRGALATIHRILKPGGTLLITVPGISQISRYDMDHWGEYWRFTGLSTQKLLEEFFPSNLITVRCYGNVLAATALLQGLVSKELRASELEYLDPDYEVVIAARAMKPNA